MKKCPFCAEEIQDEALKCKHCGEFLDTSSSETRMMRNIEKYTCPILNARFVLILGGTFMMGSSEYEQERYVKDIEFLRENGIADGREKLHRVTISRPFYLQTTPVTQQQWKRLMIENPSVYKNGKDGNMLPVENVSWDEIQEFILKLNSHTEKKRTEYRLPTEAEWEYACRAGSTTAYCFGDDPCDLSEYAWYDDNAEGVTHPVGRKKPNGWGLYDMHGNVLETVQDFFDFFTSDHLTDPKGPAWPRTRSRVVRGGYCLSDAGDCRSASRSGGGTQEKDPFLNQHKGFRLLRTP